MITTLLPSRQQNFLASQVQHWFGAGGRNAVKYHALVCQNQAAYQPKAARLLTSKCNVDTSASSLIHPGAGAGHISDVSSRRRISS